MKTLRNIIILIAIIFNLIGYFALCFATGETSREETGTNGGFAMVLFFLVSASIIFIPPYLLFNPNGIEYDEKPVKYIICYSIILITSICFALIGFYATK